MHARLVVFILAALLLPAGNAWAQGPTVSPGGGPAAGFCAPRLLSFGAAPWAGSIGSAGEVGCYRFDGAAGDRVRVRLIPTSGDLDPVATAANCATTSADDFTCTLGSTGRHSITVADLDGSGTGGYAISIQRLGNPVGCGPALSYGPAAVAGSLSAAGDSECHRFTAAAGDRVRVWAHATSTGPLAYAELVRPDGLTVCSGAGPLTCVAGVAGTYTVLVRDALPGTRTGTYGVSVQRLGNPVGCTTLTSGVHAPTAAAAATPCHRFDGSPGHRVRVRLVPLSGSLDPAVEVLRPDGTTRCALTSWDDSTCVLDAAGAHRLLVHDAARVAGSGEYAIQVRRLDSPWGCEPLPFGTQPHLGAFPRGGMSCHRFDAAAGDVVRARMWSSSVRPVWEVVRPDGTTRCGAVVIEERTCSIDVTGTHTIVVRDAPPGTSAGGHSVSLQRLNDPVGCSSAAFGPGADDHELAPAAVDCQRFTGEAGDRIRLRAVSPYANVDLVADVFGPDGYLQCSRAAAANFTCGLDETGLHTVLIRDTTGEGFGPYWTSLQRLNDPVGCMPLVPGAEPVPSSIGMLETECWRFAANPGEFVQLKLNKTWGSFKPFIELVSPSGWSLRSTTGTGTSFDSFWDLDDLGVYTILVRDGDTGLRSGNYDIQLID